MDTNDDKNDEELENLIIALQNLLTAASPSTTNIIIDEEIKNKINTQFEKIYKALDTSINNKKNKENLTKLLIAIKKVLKQTESSTTVEFQKQKIL